MNTITIQGSHINLDCPDFEEISTIEELAQLGIFNHLPEAEEDLANKELFGSLLTVE